MRLAEAIGLDADERSSLFYALLLKDAGCSSNAARVAALFGADDQAVKRDIKTVDHRRRTESLRHAARNVLPGGSPLERASQLAKMARQSGASHELYALRCERGAEVARSIDLDEATAGAIRTLDALGRGWAAARPRRG
jgi:hypothetical protein